MAAVSAQTSSSRSGHSNSHSSSNVSYEAFAPRSTVQISRLSRIAALTSGPAARGLAASGASPTDSSHVSGDILVEAMSPQASLGRDVAAWNRVYAKLDDGATKFAPAGNRVLFVSSG